MYLTLGVVLVGLLYFLVSLAGLAFFLSPGLGALACAFVRLVDPGDRGPRGHVHSLMVAGLGGVLGASAAALLGGQYADAWMWAGVVLSVAAASAIYSISARGGIAVCMRCRSPLDGASFICPRCQDRVCAKPTCWIAKFFRCTRCDENKIWVLHFPESWWRSRLGARVSKGQCNNCYGDAHEFDLRECGQCHWPTCQRCWDYHNGACQRCGWRIPDLPGRLLPFVQHARPASGPSPPEVRPAALDRPPAGAPPQASARAPRSPLRPKRPPRM